MSTLQTLRNAHVLTRLVLVWFALFIGVAVASPMVHPQGGQMICSTMGMKMVTAEDGSADKSPASSGMDCPLCASVVTPPLPVSPQFDVSSALAYALRPIPAAHIAWLTGSPLPPRGPPAFS
jgi:hypothetical protein